MAAHQIYHNQFLFLLLFIQETINYVLHSVMSVRYCRLISFLAVTANYCCRGVNWCDFPNCKTQKRFRYMPLHSMKIWGETDHRASPRSPAESRVKCWQNVHIWLLSLQRLLGFILLANNTDRVIIKWYFTTRMSLRWCFLLALWSRVDASK